MAWRPIIPPWPPIISIIFVMPSIGSPLPMRRAISIMFFIAYGAFGDCMNSRIAFRPSSVTPEPCIISMHAA